MQEDLVAPYLAAELKHAVFSMSLWKAPSPDGFHAGFYQENWDVLGADVTNVCLNILNEGSSPSRLLMRPTLCLF